MRSIGKCVAITVLFSALVGCEPGIFKGVPSPDTLKDVDLQYYWKFKLKPGSGSGVKWIMLLDENLYCMTSENKLTAIDAATGVPKWTYHGIKPSDTVFVPLWHEADMRLSRDIHGVAAIMGWDPMVKIDSEKIKDVSLTKIMSSDDGDAAVIPRQTKVEPFDALFINTNYYVTVLDRATGTVRRHITFDSRSSTLAATFAANTAGCSDKRYFYTGATGGRYHAIALNEALHAWSLSTDDMITAPLAYHNGRLFVASEDHHLYSAQVGMQGKRVWRQKLDGSVIGQIFADARGCFVPCQDNRLYAFEAMAGTMLWDPFVCAGPLTRGIQVGEDSIFQYADRDGMYAINVANGRKRWHLPSTSPCQVVGVIEGMIYLYHGQARQLQVVDELLGKVKHPVSIGRGVMFARNALMPAVYFATPDGRIFCVRLKTAGRLTEEMLRG